jgi:hypothetical protein
MLRCPPRSTTQIRGIASCVGADGAGDFSVNAPRGAELDAFAGVNNGLGQLLQSRSAGRCAGRCVRRNVGQRRAWSGRKSGKWGSGMGLKKQCRLAGHQILMAFFILRSPTPADSSAGTLPISALEISLAGSTPDSPPSESCPRPIRASDGLSACGSILMTRASRHTWR